MREVSFSYKREEGLNPYVGFMSFQHFRGEKLYSDLIVLPENNFCETEKVECYPVSRGTEENGRAEGYYPDGKLVYIRILWREFEPERGEYNYDFIDEIIRDTKAHGQTLIFRLMAHSTRAEDDVPYWLRGLMECPERPEGMRVKDSPTDPLFIDLFCEAVKAFGERYDSEPLLEMVDISLPGAWGEGHNLHLYPDNTLEKIVDTYTSVFKNTRLCAQLSKPELIAYANKTAALPVGARGDGFGQPKLTGELYPPRIEELGELWKTAPISFEAYWWIGEWERKGWDLDYIIEKSLEWHVSSFNAKSMPIPEQMREKIDNWIDKMGYHYNVSRVIYPTLCRVGDDLSFELEIDNVGVAPIYKKLPLLVRISGNGGAHVAATNADITKWLPGKNTEAITVKLPRSIPEGEYALEIGILCEDADMLYLATDAERNEGFYTLGTLKITKNRA